MLHRSSAVASPVRALHRPVRPLAPLLAFVVLYAMIYAAFGVASPYWPLFFESRGIGAEQLGIIFGLATVMRLVAGPVFGRVADMVSAPRAVLAICAALAACLASGLLLVNGFWLLALVEMGHGAALAPVTTLADALALGAAKPRSPHGFEYGWVRGSASAAFIVGTLASGQLLHLLQLPSVVWMHSALLIGAVFASAYVPGLRARPPAQSSGMRSALAGVRELYSITAYRWLIVIAALVYGSHAMHDTFSVIRWNAAGINSSTVSLLWSESVAAEVVVFFLHGPALVNRIGPSGAATLAACAGIIRWSAMALTTAPAMLALLQPLHGLTFALLHLACMRLIAIVAPAYLAATAQALYAFGIGLVTALLMFVSGALYEHLGANAFLLMAALCALALPLTVRLRVHVSPYQVS
ncbi:MAG: MFS transporter [Alphaproteobacteria bacterium]|nr:MAG: MFS transporter [Alphaproteobacteria bacterium]